LSLFSSFYTNIDSNTSFLYFFFHFLFSYINNSVVSVISAMHGVTNRLLEICNYAAKGDTVNVSRLRGALIDRHVSTARTLMSSSSSSSEKTGSVSLRGNSRSIYADEACDFILSSATSFLDNVCIEIAGKKKAEPVDTDALASVGERWSARIVASYLESQGHDAPFLESDSIVVTTGKNGGAKPILDKTKKNVDAIIQPLLARGALPIVTGFIGSAEVDFINPNSGSSSSSSSNTKVGNPRSSLSMAGRGVGGRIITTLGRSGSDLSATVLAHALDASDVWLYKVEYTLGKDGLLDDWAGGWVGVVHDADPEHTMAVMSYEEAHEMAHFAKQVLHAETVMPIKEKSIPITVRNCFLPYHPGTRIQAESDPIISFSGRVKTVTKVDLTSYESKHGNIVEGEDLSVFPNGLASRPDLALVVLVGCNIMRVPSIEKRTLSVLQKVGIPACVPKRVNNGSEHNFSVLVQKSQMRAAITALHDMIICGHKVDDSFIAERKSKANAHFKSTNV
jgi:aspartokinase